MLCDKYLSDKMAKEALLKPLVLGILFGIFGFVIGSLLTSTGVFPALEWANIGLFVGFVFGFAKDFLE